MYGKSQVMSRIEVKKYIGDDKLTLLLKEVDCNRSLGFVKAAILGALSSAQAFGIDDVLREIFGENNKPKHNTGLIRAIEALWYSLLSAKRFPRAEHIQMGPGSQSKEVLINFVSAQVLSGEEFLKYLEYGKIEKFFENKKLQKLYSLFRGNLELLKALLQSMSERWGDDQFNNTSSLTEKLGSFTQLMWDTMISIKEMSKKERIEKRKKKTIISEIETKIGQKIGRNDPCPCGSGKKYKNCCMQS